jgi:hypothetical protein
MQAAAVLPLPRPHLVYERLHSRACLRVAGGGGGLAVYEPAQVEARASHHYGYLATLQGRGRERAGMATRGAADM